MRFDSHIRRLPYVYFDNTFTDGFANVTVAIDDNNYRVKYMAEDDGYSLVGMLYITMVQPKPRFSSKTSTTTNLKRKRITKRS